MSSGTSKPSFTVAGGDPVGRLRGEFEAGWVRGSPVPLEDVVRAAPEALRPDLFRELLEVERAYRERGGRPLTGEEAHARFGALGPWAGPALDAAFATTISAETSQRVERPGDPPAVVGGYAVVRELGRGGMGVVYLVDDPLGQRQLAVKMMLPEKAANPLVRERFLREARAAAAVEHDNVVAVYEVKEEGGVPYLVMPLLRGESLEQRLRLDPLPPHELVRKVGREVALGLAAAHDKGLVHRDVKPSNVWLEGDPTASAPGVRVSRVKVLDFGLARATDGADGLSATGEVVGTPAYMAPEQARGEKVDARADLFSLGAILYRMAAGSPAFSGPTITAVLMAVATHNPPPAHKINPAVPEALSELIERLLEKDPDRRPRSARAVADALETLGQEPTATRAPGNRKRWAAIAGALALLCAIALAVRSMCSPLPPESPPQNEPKEAPPSVARSAEPNPAPTAPEPLRVKSLDVTHYANSADGDVPRGVLGRGSFEAALGDKVQVAAKLSRPAYAFVVAFRPDGVADLCFPDDEDTVPPLTDAPRYPATDSGKAYGLREGAGLWAFAVIASDKPLPTYRQWLADRKLNWKRESAPAGSVWWYDGAVLETLLPGRDPLRAKDEELAGPGATVRALGRRLKQGPDAAVGVVGFGVR